MSKIGIIGANGKMGRTLIESTIENPALELCVAIVKNETEKNELKHFQTLINNKSFEVYSSLEEAKNYFEVLIDFTHPSLAKNNLTFCYENNKSIVMGTTGLSETVLDLMDEYAQKIKIFYSENMSLGVNLLSKLLEITTKAIGNEADIEIIEAHHSKKVDAPSGTAFLLGKSIAKAKNKNIKDIAVCERHGIIGARIKEEIGFSTIRAGNIIGDHTVMFALGDEIIELKHKALNRKIFAQGAIKAAVWLNKQTNGRYNMLDLLDLTSITQE